MVRSSRTLALASLSLLFALSTIQQAKADTANLKRDAVLQCSSAATGSTGAISAVRIQMTIDSAVATSATTSFLPLSGISTLESAGNQPIASVPLTGELGLNDNSLTLNMTPEGIAQTNNAIEATLKAKNQDVLSYKPFTAQVHFVNHLAPTQQADTQLKCQLL